MAEDDDRVRHLKNEITKVLQHHSVSNGQVAVTLGLLVVAEELKLLREQGEESQRPQKRATVRS
jgi:hypothetical protein